MAIQDIEVPTNAETAILAAVSQFRFLSTLQMVDLGVSSSLRHVQRVLRAMTQRYRPLIGSLDFGAIPTIGKLHRLYYLNERGATVLEEAGYDPETLHWPRKVRLFPHDYYHRINCVDFHIAVAQWAKSNNAAVGFYDTYYDHGRMGADGRAHARSRVSWETGSLVPDSIFILTPSDGKARLCAFEMHNGTDTARLSAKLKTYVTACREQALETPYKYTSSARVLLVFEDENTLTKAGERIRRENVLQERSAQFFGHTLTAIQRNFREGWQQFGTGKTSDLF